MGYRGTLPSIEIGQGRSYGFWLVVSALLLIAVLVPPLLLPLLLVLSLMPAVVALRRPWAGAPAYVSSGLPPSRSPRAPPRR
jgi:hypothetical protein